MVSAISKTKSVSLLLVSAILSNTRNSSVYVYALEARHNFAVDLELDLKPVLKTLRVDVYLWVCLRACARGGRCRIAARQRVAPNKLSRGVVFRQQQQATHSPDLFYLHRCFLGARNLFLGGHLQQLLRDCLVLEVERKLFNDNSLSG